MMMSEATDQAALFDFLSRVEGRYPALRWVFHAPSEASGGGKTVKLPYTKRDGAQGWRSVPVEALTNARLGTKKGFPDILFVWPYYDAAANIAYPGCVVEQKYGDGRTSPEQDAWLEHFRRCGWYATVSRSWAATAKLLLRWAGGDEREVEGL